MTYHRGTLAKFNTWHSAALVSAGIGAEGRIGLVKGYLAPNNQRTTTYSSVISHPSNADDYIWGYGNYPDGEKTSLTRTEVKTAGWFPEGE